MRIKMLTLMSKPTYTAKPGDVLDLPAKEAESLIAGKFAVAVANDPVRAADTKANAEADVVEVPRPGPAASKAAWVAWVVHEYDVAEADAKVLSKKDLIDFDAADGHVDDDEDDEAEDAADGDGDAGDDEDDRQ
jgi:hypothetical protein